MVLAENYPDTIPLIVQKMVADSRGNSRFRRQPSDGANQIFVNYDRVQFLAIENRVYQPLNGWKSVSMEIFKHFKNFLAKLTCRNASTNHCNNLFESMPIPVFD